MLSGRPDERAMDSIRLISSRANSESGDWYASLISCTTPEPVDAMASTSATSSSAVLKRVPSGEPSLVRWM
ncbi:unannotated protein [freshwater metagenome]|uniref:Unannotated protein n=1 Tax=freshwater metagenome TaxID=449393 RepID=A0A6J6EAI2_9ZZZZ